MHDGLAQVLAFALIQLDAARQAPADARDVALRHGHQLVKDALRTTRDVIDGLRDPALPPATELGLRCRQLADEVGQLARQRIDTDCRQIAVALPANVEPLLLRATRELLVNACKHAPGARIGLSLRETESRPPGIELTVSDDGPGFDPACLQHTVTGNLGLRELPMLLGMIGVEFRLRARPGAGVVARLRWLPAGAVTGQAARQ